MRLPRRRVRHDAALWTMPQPESVPAQTDAGARPTRFRWVVVALLFGAIVLSYVDRQTFGLLKAPMSAQLGWSNGDFADIHICFQAAYALCYLLWGRMVDRIGARYAMALSLLIWSCAQIAISGAARLSAFMLARGALGAGESGAFPSAIKAVVEWFPQRERSFASGVFNSGSNLGAILAPFAVPAIALRWGWQAAFVATGLLGLAWLPLWFFVYRAPRFHACVNAAELAWIEQDAPSLATRASWARTLARRESWAYALGRACSDPIFGMYLVWLPDFLARRHGLGLSALGWPLATIYLLSDAGSITGGWLSSYLMRRGVGVNVARKATLALCAACATPVVFAPFVDALWPAVLLIGLAAAAHQGFSATLLALPGDLVPRASVGSVAGLGGLCGAGAGIAMSKYTGFVLDRLDSYAPVFVVAGCAYWIALGLIHVLSPRLAIASE
jgi:ACS family hexuronate transporter-like MFS transporter